MKKTMNYYLMAILGLMMVMALTSCGTPSRDTTIKRFQKTLPRQWGEHMTITKCGVVGDYLEMEIVNDETEFEFESDDFASALEIVMNSMKQQLVHGFVSDATMNRMLRACKEEGKGFRVVYVSEKSGLRVKLEFTPEEIRELIIK